MRGVLACDVMHGVYHVCACDDVRDVHGVVVCCGFARGGALYCVIMLYTL